MPVLIKSSSNLSYVELNINSRSVKISSVVALDKIALKIGTKNS